jgi:hypothetical protein
MTRSFLSSFLLPLVRGGRLHVGRPLGARAVDRLERLVAARGEAAQRDDDAGDAGEAGAIGALAASRRAVASRFLRDAATPPLDEATLRLGAAVHDLLVLVHPGIEGPRVARRQERIAAAAQALAALGAPRSEVETVNRHSLLARLPEIARTDSTVSFWLGRQVFVGRVPPPRVTALPALRRVHVDVVRRSWLREIGVPAVARDAVLTLGIASPLGEALDPLRLEPPPCWSRILPVLRAPALGRIVAGRMLEIGLPRAGDGLAAALLRFASFQDPPGGVAATPDAVAFALSFLAHLVWLDVLFGEAGWTGATAAAGAPGGSPSLGADLALMLSAADRLAPVLLWAPDVARDSDLGRAFRARLELLGALARSRGASAAEAAEGVVAFARDGTTTRDARAARGDAPPPINI